MPLPECSLLANPALRLSSLPPQSTELIGPDEYSRVITPEGALTEEHEEVCGMLAECLEMRRKWLFKTAGEWQKRYHMIR